MATATNQSETADIGITAECKDGVSVIRFTRAQKKNAFTGDMYDRMSELLQSGDQNDDVRCHVFLGSAGVFSAGNDIQDFIDHGMKQGGLGQEVLNFLRTLVTTQKPLVAGVDGLAIGIGTTMLMHCDLVYSSERSFFQTPFVDLGLVPEAASSLVAPRLMGHQKAFALLALGERFSPHDAERCGLINKIVDADVLESVTLAAAANLAAKPVSALATTRQLVRGDSAEILQRIEEEAEHFSAHLATADAQNAFSRFMQKSVREKS